MKKIKNWLYWNGMDIVLVVLFIFCITLACLIGYTVGEKDGYTEGYIHASTNNYEQSPGGSVLDNAQDWGKNAKRMLSIYTNKEENPESTEHNKLAVPEINIQYLEETSYIQDNLWKSLQLIPHNILVSFQQEEWTLEICKELPMSTYKGSEFNAAGLTKSVERKIIIEAGSSELNSIVAHEFGHYVDFLNFRPSKTEEWETLYIEEWKGVYKLTHSFHSVDAPVEFFASVFDLYIRKPKSLEIMCPNSFSAMKELLSQYE